MVKDGGGCCSQEKSVKAGKGRWEYHATSDTHNFLLIQGKATAVSFLLTGGQEQLLFKYVGMYQLKLEFEAIPKKLQDVFLISWLINVVLRGSTTDQNNSSSSAFQFLAISQYPFSLSPNTSFASRSVGQLFALKLLNARSLSMPSQTR